MRLCGLHSPILNAQFARGEIPMLHFHTNLWLHLWILPAHPGRNPHTSSPSLWVHDLQWPHPIHHLSSILWAQVGAIASTPSVLNDRFPRQLGTTLCLLSHGPEIFQLPAVLQGQPRHKQPIAGVRGLAQPYALILYSQQKLHLSFTRLGLQIVKAFPHPHVR